MNTRKTSILSGEERQTMGPCRKGGRRSNECVVDGLNFLRAMQYKDAYLNGLVDFPTFFNFSLNLAIRSS